jgi:hypothetical protein
MAGALAGEGGDLDTVVLVSCRTMVSCDRGGDVRRETQWVRAADEVNGPYGSPHLHMTCRTHYGGILFAAGRWAQAERELTAALDAGRAAEPALHVEALARLAELSLGQGRTEEAVRLLEGYADHPGTARVIGAIHLTRDDPGPAATVLRRGLAEIDEGSPDAVGLGELLIEAEIARGELESATARAEQLLALASHSDSPLVTARAHRALGRVLTEAADVAALAPLDVALAAFRRLEMPFEASRTRLLIATMLADKEPETATAEARAALAMFEELGAGPEADASAALLRSFGLKIARSSPKGVGLLTKRELEILRPLGRDCRIRRSPSACSSRARRSSTTSEACWEGSGWTAAVKRPPTRSAISPRREIEPRNRGLPPCAADRRCADSTQGPEEGLTHQGGSRGHAVVIGASIAGLLAARALSEAYEQVTIIERDELPPMGEGRKSVPQDRHAHVLLASGLRAVEELLPGITDDLIGSGAQSCTSLSQIRLVVSGHLLNRDAQGADVLLASRPLIEGRLRRRVLASPNVTVRASCVAGDLIASSDRTRITGVRIHPQGRTVTEETCHADLTSAPAGARRGSRRCCRLWAIPDRRRSGCRLTFGTPAADCDSTRTRFRASG